MAFLWAMFFVICIFFPEYMILIVLVSFFPPNSAACWRRGVLRNKKGTRGCDERKKMFRNNNNKVELYPVWSNIDRIPKDGIVSDSIILLGQEGMFRASKSIQFQFMRESYLHWAVMGVVDLYYLSRISPLTVYVSLQPYDEPFRELIKSMSKEAGQKEVLKIPSKFPQRKKVYRAGEKKWWGEK